MSISKLKKGFFNGSWINDVKHYFTKTNEIIDQVNTNTATLDAIPASPKIYKANIAQLSSGANISVVSKDVDGNLAPFVDTIGSPVWTRGSAGSYSLTKTGAFPVDKLYIAGFSNWLTGNTSYIPILSGAAIVGYYQLSYSGSDDAVFLYVVDNTFAGADLYDLIGTNALSLPTIEVYP